MSTESDGVVGVLLAGGLSRRMGGGDKCLLRLGGETLLGCAITGARPQVASLIINANGDASRFADYGLPVVADAVAGFAGPLAGVLAGMEWANQSTTAASWIATFATDAPYFPADLVARMRRAIEDEGAELACATSAGRAHPVFGLWPVHLAPELRRVMTEEGVRKIDIWTARHRLTKVAFPTEPLDPFFNINHPGDLDEARASLRTAAAPR